MRYNFLNLFLSGLFSIDKDITKMSTNSLFFLPKNNFFYKDGEKVNILRLLNWQNYFISYLFFLVFVGEFLRFIDLFHLWFLFLLFGFLKLLFFTQFNFGLYSLCFQEFRSMIFVIDLTDEFSLIDISKYMS